MNGFFKFISYTFLFLVFAFVAYALYFASTADVNTTQASSAPVTGVTEHTVTVTSDPAGASVFWDGEPYSLDVTPASISISEGSHSYRVAFEDYDVESNLYKPYRGKLNVTKDETVDVWLDRRTQAEVEEHEARRAETERLAACAASADHPLMLESWSWSKENGYAIAEGQVTNQSGSTLEYVMVQVEFYTSDQTFITADDSYIDYTTLLPGQSSPFKVYADENPAMAGADVYFKINGELIHASKREDDCF